jgi:hypothetical protein
MRQTMRKNKDDDTDEALLMRRHKKHGIDKLLAKKHPNKHHEGDRKRWRDEVTEAERKRYEGVWASNKGWLCPEDEEGADGGSSGLGEDRDKISPVAAAAMSASTSGPPRLPPRSESMLSVSSAGPAAVAAKSSPFRELVCNLVVRDIWSRSRLGPDILSEIWELVDRSHSGYLCKEEFVAGLWLIDQRLKGRKLPIRLGDSVWTSIGGMAGVKIRHPRQGHRRHRKSRSRDAGSPGAGGAVAGGSESL